MLGLDVAMTFKVLIKHAIYAIVFLIATVELSTESFAILAIIVILDTVTGVARTYALNGGRSIRSYKLMAGITSKLLVILIPLIVAWAGRGAGINLTAVAQGALSVIILSEAYSVLCNIHAIVVREDTHEFDAIGWVMNNFKNILERILNSNNLK